jgi:hypothetical protein
MMKSVAVPILALFLVGTAYLGQPCPAYAKTGGCHHTCTDAWLAQRDTVLRAWATCKAGCNGLGSKAKRACSVACFNERNAGLAQARQDLNACFRACVGK